MKWAVLRNLKRPAPDTLLASTRCSKVTMVNDLKKTGYTGPEPECCIGKYVTTKLILVEIIFFFLREMNSLAAYSGQQSTSTI